MTCYNLNGDLCSFSSTIYGLTLRESPPISTTTSSIPAVPRLPQPQPPQQPVQQSSSNQSEILYMIFGIVMGAISLLLVVFIVLCLIRQRQHNRLLAQLHNTSHKLTSSSCPTLIYEDSLRQQSAAAAAAMSGSNGQHHQLHHHLRQALLSSQQNGGASSSYTSSKLIDTNLFMQGPSSSNDSNSTNSQSMSTTTSSMTTPPALNSGLRWTHLLENLIVGILLIITQYISLNYFRVSFLIGLLWANKIESEIIFDSKKRFLMHLERLIYSESIVISFNWFFFIEKWYF